MGLGLYSFFALRAAVPVNDSYSGLSFPANTLCRFPELTPKRLSVSNNARLFVDLHHLYSPPLIPIGQLQWLPALPCSVFNVDDRQFGSGRCMCQRLDTGQPASYAGPTNAAECAQMLCFGLKFSSCTWDGAEVAKGTWVGNALALTSTSSVLCPPSRRRRTSSCPSGMFQTATPQGESFCKQHRPSCSVFEQEVAVPTSTSDRVCTPMDISVAVSWPLPLASDNSGKPSIASSLQSGALFSLGEHAVTVSVSDPSANTVSCNFTVTVCPFGFYGKGCTGECRCADDRRCHPANGECSSPAVDAVEGPPGGSASGGAPAGCPSTYVDAELLLTGLPQGYFDFFSNRNALLRSFCDNLAATSRPSDFCDNCVRIVSAITLTERRRAVVDSGGMQVQVVVRVHTEVQDAPEVQAANLDTIVRSGLVDQPTVVVAASWGDPQGAVAVAPMETSTTVGPSTTTTVEAAVSAATKRKILILIVVFALILLLLFVLLFVFLRRRAVLQERLCEHQALQNRKGTISDPAPLLITHVMHVPSMGFMDASSYSGSHSESGRSVGSGNHKYQKPAWMMKFEDPVCMYPLDMLAFQL